MELKSRLGLFFKMLAVVMMVFIAIAAASVIFNSHPTGYEIGVGVATLAMGCVGAWALKKTIIKGDE